MLEADLAQAYELGLRGDLEAIDAVLARDALPRAWWCAFSALRWFAAPDAARFPEAIAGEAAEQHDAPAIAARALAHAARAAALAFDARALADACRALAPLAAADEEARAWLAIANAWFGASFAANVAELERAAKYAADAKRADLLLEATSLRALAALNAGELEDALALSRRASRMARTESLPQLEYLANLVLARARRVLGKPHLATRILGALLAVASKPWQTWLAWESILSTGTAVRETTTPLAAVLEAARAGDRATFEAAFAAARNAIGSSAPHARDLEELRAAIDPAASLAEVAPDVRAYLNGESDALPPRLLGLLAPGAWVFAPRASPPRRVLGAGAGLLGAPLALLEESPQLRTDSAIALLALAGDKGVDEDVLFRRLYGFEYEAARHQSVRGVLYNRVRQRLGTSAELSREDHRLRLGPHGDLILPDPKASPPPEMRILQVLAERRRAAPKDVAAQLGIPLRTVQDALRRLTDDGALKRDKAARGLQYILEDTTFAEPTRVRRAQIGRAEKSEG